MKWEKGSTAALEKGSTAALCMAAHTHAAAASAGYACQPCGVPLHTGRAAPYHTIAAESTNDTQALPAPDQNGACRPRLTQRLTQAGGLTASRARTRGPMPQAAGRGNGGGGRPAAHQAPSTARVYYAYHHHIFALAAILRLPTRQAEPVRLCRPPRYCHRSAPSVLPHPPSTRLRAPRAHTRVTPWAIAKHAIEHTEGPLPQ